MKKKKKARQLRIIKELAELQHRSNCNMSYRWHSGTLLSEWLVAH